MSSEYVKSRGLISSGCSELDLIAYMLIKQAEKIQEKWYKDNSSRGLKGCFDGMDDDYVNGASLLLFFPEIKEDLYELSNLIRAFYQLAVEYSKKSGSMVLLTSILINISEPIRIMVLSGSLDEVMDEHEIRGLKVIITKLVIMGETENPFLTENPTVKL